jgi:hypothetical protein
MFKFSVHGSTLVKFFMVVTYSCKFTHNILSMGKCYEPFYSCNFKQWCDQHQW